jgi:phage protein D
MNPRSASLQVHYNNVNISADLQSHLLSWKFTDNMSGQADDLQITLEDTKQLWSGSWMPDKGASLTAQIIRNNWLKSGQIDQLTFGQFEVDEIDIEYPPSIVTIKALSVPESSSLRGQAKNRAWEKTYLSVVAKDIANGSKLKLYFDTEYDPDYDRVEQTGETDLAFLQRLCDDAGLCLKVTDKQIVIFDEQKYENQAPVATIKKGDAYIKSYSGKSTMNGLYKSCHVEYKNPNTGQVISYTFTPTNPPKTDKILYVNDRVSSYKQAEMLAKKRLRDANKEGMTFSITLLGDTRFLAAMTVNLSGFGKFDGKYIITQAIHSQQNGYETSLQLRKCLEGY